MSATTSAEMAVMEDLAELARNFFVTEVAPSRDESETRGYPNRDLYRRAGDLGLLCMSIPEEYGGGGGTFAHEAVLFAEQVKAGDSTLQLGVHAGIVPHYLLAYASEENKRRWLPRLASGEWVGAIAMTEPTAGSDLQNITTKAVRDGDFYVLSGAKTFISNGRNCNLIIVAAKTDPTLGGKGVSLIVAEVADDTPGFTRGRPLKKIGQKGQDTTEIFFDGLRVPASNLLGAGEGQGFVQLMEQLPHERLICGVAAVAMMEAAVATTVEYTKGRSMFGKSLYDMQNTRFELADCATAATVAKVFLDNAVDKHLAGELDVRTAAMVKYWTTEQQFQVVDRCLQLHGGYGYMDEYPIARMFVDARISRIYAGANEVMKDLVARHL
jgi:acyl-CoA dehydrogenase